MKRIPVRSIPVFVLIFTLIFTTTATFAAEPVQAGQPNTPLIISAEPDLDVDRTPGKYGYIPSAFDTSGIDDYDYSQKKQTGLGFSEILPAAFDWRAQPSPNPATAVRDQGSWGTCWAFSAVTSAAGSLASRGIIQTAPLLLSPYHLIFSVYNDETYPGYGVSSTSKMNAGGNADMAALAMTKWFGPVLESKFPYPSVGTPANLGDMSKIRSADYHLQNVYYFPGPRDSNGVYSPDNVEEIKYGVKNYGPLKTSYHENESYYKASTYGYYCDSNITENHGVVVVGWDDNFSKTKFNTTPEGDGAFLIQNSWGPYSRNGGYFWISYYDKSLTSSTWFGLESKTNYEDIDYHDGLNTMSYSYGMPNVMTEYMANVYTADEGIAAQEIEAVGVFSRFPGYKYEVSVYRNPTASNPVAGEKVDTGVTVQTVPYGGYHTIPLTIPAKIPAGEKYAVVVRVTKQTMGQFALTCEGIDVSRYPGNIVGIGESYYGTDGVSWMDIYQVCQTPFSGSFYCGNFVLKIYKDNIAASGISIPSASGIQTIYNKGDALDRSKGSIQVRYEDGSTANVPLNSNQITITGYNPNQLGSQTLTISYGGKTVTYQVQVTSNPAPVIMSGITIPANSGIRTEYMQGESLDRSVGSIRANYSNGNAMILPLSDGGITITGYNPNQIGIQTLTIHYGGRTTTCSIRVRGTLQTSMAGPLPSFVYNGAPHSPTPTLVDGGAALQAGVDFTFTLQNNVGAGTATVVVSGMGNYTGQISLPFVIQKANQTLSLPAAITKTQGSGAFSLGGKRSTGDGAVTYRSGNPSVALVDGAGKVTIKGPGKAIVTMSAAATANYHGASIQTVIRVLPKKVAIGKPAAPGKGKLTVKWSAVPGSDGYRILLATDKQYRKNKKDVVFAGGKTVKKTLTKLKKGQLYYIKVCAWKTIDGKKVFGGWSGVKQIRVR